MFDPLSVNGDPPALVGLPCEELLVSEYWHKGELVEPANVIYLRFGGRWHRLYFDWAIVFWRPHDVAPEAVPQGEDDFAYPLVDVGRRFGVRGVLLDGLMAAPIYGGSEVRFEFRNGMVLVFSSVADTTTYSARPGAAADGGGMSAFPES
jgi:hypothetical protein